MTEGDGITPTIENICEALGTIEKAIFSLQLRVSKLERPRLGYPMAVETSTNSVAIGEE